MPRRFLGGSIRLTLLAALVGGGLGLSVRLFAYYPLKVVSNSMSPTVETGDWVIVAPISATFPPHVQRGDILVFRFPYGGSGRAIKRVVAISGDEMAITDGGVAVNGQMVSYGGQTRTTQSVATPESPRYLIPNGYYFILGDNTSSSLDSRTLGLLPQADLLGKVALVIRSPWR